MIDKAIENNLKTTSYNGILFSDYIKENYIPLSVIEDIKAEISKLSDIKWIDEKTQEFTNWQGMKKKVLSIIDKHCGGDKE